MARLPVDTAEGHSGKVAEDGEHMQADSHSQQQPAQLTRQDAAKFLTERGFPIAASTLAKKAVMGGGPPYRIWNSRATYSVDDLVAWADKSRGALVSHTAQRHPQSARLDGRAKRQ
jgi:hypothetical protein